MNEESAMNAINGKTPSRDAKSAGKEMGRNAERRQDGGKEKGQGRDQGKGKGQGKGGKSGKRDWGVGTRKEGEGVVDGATSGAAAKGDEGEGMKRLPKKRAAVLVGSVRPIPDS
jgi:hypothetical protein